MEFTIPLDKDDLLQRNDGQYHVKELISPRCIPQALDGKKKLINIIYKLLFIFIVCCNNFF